MSSIQRPTSLYGFEQPLTPAVRPPIISQRAPKTTDYAPLGQEWVFVPSNEVFFLTSIVSNVATWILIAPSGGIGNFSSLTVNPGLTNLSALTQVGATNINATGANLTTIGTGGTGAVHIGNATGNTAVTGTLGVTGAITATLSITATQGLVGQQVIATGDLGNGFVAETSLTNATVAAGGTSAGMVVQTSAGAGTTASAGFIRMYVGVTPVFVPYWTQTT